MTQAKADDLDSYYEDSIFSVTEDVQYPLFDADEAKEGIISGGAKAPSQKPILLQRKSEKSKFKSSNISPLLKENPVNPRNVFESQIKIDEPLEFEKEEGVPTPQFRQHSTFFNRASTLGLGDLVPPSGARRVEAHRPQFRPRQINIPSRNSREESKEELSPRSRMMPGLAEKVNSIVKEGLNNSISELIKTTSSSDDNKPENEEKVEEINNNVKLKSKPNKVKEIKPASMKKKPAVVRDDESDVKSKQGLSGRKDVVYKTLLRSIKRYYSNEFEQKTEYSNLTKSKQEKRCVEITNQFTRSQFAEFLKTEKLPSGEEKTTVNDVELDSVVSFILALILPSYVKRNMKNSETYETYDIFYECLYRYSHKRLESALTIPAVSCVFKIFLEGPMFQHLLANDNTLSKNSEAYESAKEEFLDIINKRS